LDLILAILSPVHTVAEKCNCRRKRRGNGEIQRLSHFSATCGQAFRAQQNVSLPLTENKFTVSECKKYKV